MKNCSMSADRSARAVSWLSALGVGVMVATVFVSPADGEWIWTPETGWMSRKYIPKATAREQFEHATKLHEEGQYPKAAVAFILLGDFYPDSPFVEQADFMRAECLFLMGRNVTAFRAFEEFLKKYPDSENRAKAIERELEIGKVLLAGAKKDFIGGMKLVRDKEEGVRIIERAVGHDPYHDRVPKALMLIGDARFNGRWYSEAKLNYSRIVEEYPKSPVRPEAEYRAVLCDAKTTEDVDYDTSDCVKIEKRCKRLEAKSEGEVAEMAAGLAERMRNRRARKDFEVAEFYRRTGRRAAALTCYELVVKDYDETEWARKAKSCIEKLSGR